MFEHFLSSNESATLTDSEFIQEFISNYRYGTDVTDLLAEASRALGVASSLEDLLVITNKTEVITPTQKALIQINGNMAVAGTDKDPEMFTPTNISSEAFRTSSNNTIINSSATFVTIWTTLLKRLNSIKTINEFVNDSSFNIGVKLSDSKNNISATHNPIRSTELSSILKHSLVDTRGVLKQLDIIRDNYFTGLKPIGVKCLDQVNVIIKDGIGSFSGQTVVAAQEAFKQVQKYIATESITKSEDGLIITVDATKLSKNNTLSYSFEETSVTDLFSKLTNNSELIAASDIIVDQLRDTNITAYLEKFDKTVKSFLESLAAYSKTKEVITGYCFSFIEVATLVNSLINELLWLAQFIFAYNELISQFELVSQKEEV